MKKIFTTILLMSMLLTAQAGMTLSLVTSYDENEDEVLTDITKDTTIVVSDYHVDDFDESLMVMGVSGYITTESSSVKVNIVRSAAGLSDQFCMGVCANGNGETKQEINAPMFSASSSWYTHFYPTAAGTTTIAYTFNDGVNPAITLTVKYCYLTNAVENVATPNTNGVIYNILGYQMPSNELSELPAGIYIINGKKYIKQ